MAKPNITPNSAGWTRDWIMALPAVLALALVSPASAQNRGLSQEIHSQEIQLGCKVGTLPVEWPQNIYITNTSTITIKKKTDIFVLTNQNSKVAGGYLKFSAPKNIPPKSGALLDVSNGLLQQVSNPKGNTCTAWFLVPLRR